MPAKLPFCAWRSLPFASDCALNARSSQVQAVRPEPRDSHDADHRLQRRIRCLQESQFQRLGSWFVLGSSTAVVRKIRFCSRRWPDEYSTVLALLLRQHKRDHLCALLAKTRSKLNLAAQVVDSADRDRIGLSRKELMAMLEVCRTFSLQMSSAAGAGGGAEERSAARFRQQAGPEGSDDRSRGQPGARLAQHQRQVRRPAFLPLSIVRAELTNVLQTMAHLQSCRDQGRRARGRSVSACVGSTYFPLLLVHRSPLLTRGDSAHRCN